MLVHKCGDGTSSWDIVSEVACLAFKSKKCLRVKNDSFHRREKKEAQKIAVGIQQCKVVHFWFCCIQWKTMTTLYMISVYIRPINNCLHTSLLLLVSNTKSIFSSSSFKITNDILFSLNVKIYLYYERRGLLRNVLAQTTRANTTATTEKESKMIKIAISRAGLYVL